MDIFYEILKIIAVYAVMFFAYELIFKLLLGTFDPEGFGRNLAGAYKTVVTLYTGILFITFFAFWLTDTTWSLIISVMPMFYIGIMSIPFYLRLIKNIKSASHP